MARKVEDIDWRSKVSGLSVGYQNDGQDVLKPKAEALSVEWKKSKKQKKVSMSADGHPGKEQRDRKHYEGHEFVLMSDIMNLHQELLTENGWKLAHIDGDHYLVNGRKVRISSPLAMWTAAPEWEHLSSKLGPGTAKMASGLMVNDGPLQQSLFDYLMQTGKNEYYDTRGTENRGVLTGAAKNLEFLVPETVLCDRHEAMRAAKAQANLRQATSDAEIEERVKNDLVVPLALKPRTRTSSCERASSCERMPRNSSWERMPRNSSCDTGRSGSVSSKLRSGPSRYARGRGAAPLGGA